MMHYRFFNYAFLVLALGFMTLSFTGCAKPRPIKLAATPDGPPSFRKGWDDGCESGMATESNTYYKSFYTFKQDAYAVTDPMYFGAWFDAFRYCRDYVDKWTFDEMDAAGIIDPNK